MKTLRNAGIASIVSLVAYVLGLIITYSTKDINQLKNFVMLDSLLGMVLSTFIYLGLTSN